MDRWLLALCVVTAIAAAWLLSRRLREARRAPERVDAEELGVGGEDGVGVVVFTSPYCVACRAWKEALDATSTPYVEHDVARRPDLARRYGVHHTPLVLAVRAGSGEVAAAYDREPEAGDVSHVSALVAA